MSRPQVHVVVHVLGADQAIEQVRVAQGEGADGAWLIDHAGDHHRLRRTMSAVRDVVPDFWLGVNFLDLTVDRAAAFVDARMDGLWSDNACVHVNEDREIALRALRVRASRGWEGHYFGGVAFKGQRLEEDVADAAERAIGLMDVVTTSGAGTGLAAPEEKLRRMHAALAGRCPLALASGVTPENVETYLPYVSFLLVATGVSETFHKIDPKKLQRLVARVGAWESS